MSYRGGGPAGGPRPGEPPAGEAAYPPKRQGTSPPFWLFVLRAGVTAGGAPEWRIWAGPAFMRAGQRSAGTVQIRLLAGNGGGLVCLRGIAARDGVEWGQTRGRPRALPPARPAAETGG